MNEFLVSSAAPTGFEEVDGAHSENPKVTSRHLWCSLEEAAQSIGVEPDAMIPQLIPMSYYPDPRPGQIRFRVMGTPRRTEVWLPDLVTIQMTQRASRPTGRRAMPASPA